MYMTHARGAMRRNSHAIEKKSTGVKSQKNCQSRAPVSLPCVNENKQGEDISELRNAIPLSLRKYFSEEIKKMKDSLK